MTSIIVALYDTKVKEYSIPTFIQNKGAALRALEELVNDGQSAPSKYPQDFLFFQIGEYESATGVITPCLPFSLGTALEFVRGTNVSNLASANNLNTNQVTQ